MTLVPQKVENMTQVRVRVQIPAHYRQEPVISQLVASYGLVVNITSALLGESTNGYGSFDLELRGSTHQIHQGLAFLTSLGLKVIGKPGTCDDSWHC
uniref:NIL domain-containing protein n=1 Tax=Oscillatoriales cyanobacterium SpSt-418 TaxID=2282169 RepID=A0A7C3KF47_9CYAN